MNHHLSLNKLFICSLVALVPMLLAACDQLPTTVQGSSGQAGEAQPSQVPTLEMDSTVEFTGTLEGAGEGSYTVGGYSFVFDDDSEIGTGLELGAPVTMEVLIRPDSSLYILGIHAAEEGDDPAGDEQEDAELEPSGDLDGDNEIDDDPDEDETGDEDVQESEDVDEQEDAELNLSGVVEAIGPESWVINGQTVLVNAESEIDDGIAPGATVWVEVVVIDGQFWANEIVLDEAVDIESGDDLDGDSEMDDAGDDYEDDSGSGGGDDDYEDYSGGGGDDDHEDDSGGGGDD